MVVDDEKSVNETTAWFHVLWRTVTRLITKFHQTGTVEDKQHIGRPTALTNQLRRLVSNEIGRNPSLIPLSSVPFFTSKDTQMSVLRLLLLRNL
jgi:hypothetical protein